MSTVIEANCSGRSAAVMWTSLVSALHLSSRETRVI